MRRIIKLMLCVITLSMFMLNTALANTYSQPIPSNGDESVLLEDGSTSSRSVFRQYGRGDVLAEAYVEITNLENGELEVEAMTLAYRNVDRILHTVFLDVWDEDEEDWVCLNYWDFERYKEDVENNDLYMFLTRFTLTGYEVGRYYRVRGLHGVELYDELEACATETNGVQLTDWRDW